MAAVLAAGCASVVNPVTGQSERTVMDEASEVAEGRTAHAQVLEEYAVYPDERLQAYVSQLGQKLAASSHRAQLKWTFTVLDSDEVNAFALPGGYVYVTRGIMAYLDSEADLAGVMGHEIGHVTARHGAQRATRQQTAGFGVLAASVLGAVLGIGDVANQVSQAAAAGYVASYSRDQELQADQLGAEYLSRNRLDPEHMVGVIGVLQQQERFAADNAKAEGRQVPQGRDWLASHPSNDQRLRDLQAITGRFKGPWDDEGRERYLRAVDGMVFGESRRQGVTRGRNFYHEPLELALTAPPGWTVQNGNDAIVIANAARDAGLIVQLVPPDSGSTHEEIVRKLLKPVSGQLSPRTVNGFAATRFVGVRQNAQGQAQNVTATVITGPKQQAYLLLYASKDAAALQRNAAALQEAENGFRALTAADRAAGRPWVVRTVPYPKDGFEGLARRSPLPRAEAQLRLVNGVYGGGEPRPGALVKVVE
jgi:predicted Zn-dependent protease